MGRASEVLAIANELRLELTSTNPLPKRKAHQFPVAFVISWETVVMQEAESLCRRLYCWYRLVALWAALRTADCAGTPAKRIKLCNGDLFGSILVSKTTGAGKKVGELFFTVCAGAWISQPLWLETGFKLYALQEFDVPFMLPLPYADDHSFSRKEPTFLQEVTALRKQISETRKLEWTIDLETGWPSRRFVGARVLPLVAHMFWSGHSGRATLNSWAAAIGISKDRRDYINRCSPSESDEYVRTSRAIIAELQKEVALAIRKAGACDAVHEKDLINELAEFCEERGVPKDEIQGMRDNLQTLKIVGLSGKPEEMPDLTVPGSLDVLPAVVAIPDEEEGASGGSPLVDLAVDEPVVLSCAGPGNLGGFIWK